MSRWTWIACHWEPRAVVIWRSFNALAMPVAVMMPAARISAIVPARSARLADHFAKSQS
jgi:hypothetical protein